MAFFAGAQFALGAGSGLLASRSERRARRRANEEARQARKQLKETSASASALVQDQANAAAAPLERIAASAKDLRSPLLRDAISSGVRQQAEAESVREGAQAGALTGRRRAGQVLLRLLTSQGLTGAEQARTERARANLSLRANLLRESGAIRTEGARTAASIMTNAQSQIAGIRQDFGPDTALMDGLGGLNATLAQLSEEDRGAFDEFLGDFFDFGGDDAVPPSISIL